MNITNLKENAATVEKQSDRTQVMIVAGKSALRTQLVNLVEGQFNFEVCAQAENISQVTKAFQKTQIDFAIICTPAKDQQSDELAKKIKFERPDLPLLFFSTSQLSVAAHTLDQKDADQIVEAIHYIENLLKNNIFGFAVLVNIE